MTPDERYEGLSAVPAALLESLADLILARSAVSVEVVAGPEVVTTPLRLPVPGSTGTAVIGHVALTTCTVHLGDARGDGCRPGRDLPGAVAAAVCDAEAERDGPQRAAVERLAAEGGDARAARRADAAAVVAATRLEAG